MYQVKMCLVQVIPLQLLLFTLPPLKLINLIVNELNGNNNNFGSPSHAEQPHFSIILYVKSSDGYCFC